MSERSVALVNDDYAPLQCPRCGESAEESFDAAVRLLVGGDGIPCEVGSYLAVAEPLIKCFNCDTKGSPAEFALDPPTSLGSDDARNASNEPRGPLEVLVDEDPSALRCPACGNAGESLFETWSSVLVGGDGAPSRIYFSPRDAPRPWRCLGCDHGGPWDEFAASERQGGYEGPTRSIPGVLDDYAPLRCPRCGNTGDHGFAADAKLLIGGDGAAFEVRSYLATQEHLIDCFGCDYMAAHSEFAQDTGPYSIPQKLMIRIELLDHTPVRCPMCGNAGESSFEFDSFVLIRGDGVPYATSYWPTELHEPSLRCLGCGHDAALDSFEASAVASA